MKLTQAQQDIYEAMKQGAVVHFMPYAGRFNPQAYYFRTDTNKRCTKQAEALIKLGLIEAKDQSFRGATYKVKA